MSPGSQAVGSSLRKRAACFLAALPVACSSAASPEVQRGAHRSSLPVAAGGDNIKPSYRSLSSCCGLEDPGSGSKLRKDQGPDNGSCFSHVCQIQQEVEPGWQRNAELQVVN